MNLWTIPKVIMAGVTAFILAQILYIGVLVKIDHYELLRLLLLPTPFVVALFTALLSPSRKLIVGIFMAPCGALIGMVSAAIYEAFGLHIDHIGGLLATFVILIAYNGVLSTLGAVVGYYFSRKSRSFG